MVTWFKANINDVINHNKLIADKQILGISKQHDRLSGMNKEAIIWEIPKHFLLISDLLFITLM